MALTNNDPTKKYKPMENVLIHVNSHVIALQDKEKKRNKVILDVVSAQQVIVYLHVNVMIQSSLWWRCQRKRHFFLAHITVTTMARSLASGRNLLPQRLRGGLRPFVNKLERLPDDLVLHQDVAAEEEQEDAAATTTKNVTTPAIRYNVCRERGDSIAQKYQFRKSAREEDSIKDVSAENVNLPAMEPAVFEQNVGGKEPAHSPGYQQFRASSTYKNLVLPLKASKLSDPFPTPVKTMPSHTVSDQEKARQMMAERRLPGKIDKKKM